MYAANVNGTTSYQHYQQAQVRQLIAGMSDEEKQHMLDTIKTHQGVSNLTGQQYDIKMLHYIENLLTGVNEWRNTAQNVIPQNPANTVLAVEQNS